MHHGTLLITALIQTSPGLSDERLWELVPLTAITLARAPTGLNHNDPTVRNRE